MGIRRVECLLSCLFFLSRQPETRGGLYIWGTPDYGLLFIQSRGQMLWKIGQFAYHPEWSFSLASGQRRGRTLCRPHGDGPDALAVLFVYPGMQGKAYRQSPGDSGLVHLHEQSSFLPQWRYMHLISFIGNYTNYTEYTWHG